MNGVVVGQMHPPPYDISRKGFSTGVEAPSPRRSHFVESVDGEFTSPTRHRGTLWETWGARQGWIKGMKAASTVATLALGLLALVETALLFGVGKESIIETNRSRARIANAWQAQGKPGKGSKRAAAVAASEAISVLPEIETSNGDEAAVSSAGGSSGSRKRSSGASQSASAGGGGGSGNGGEAVGSPSATGGSKSGSKRQKR